MKGIYKITNKLNNKVYIGQSIHCGKRLDEHCRGQQYIDTLINKIGIENFSFEILKEVQDDDQLSYWEDYYIHLYNSLYPNGYNKRLNTSINMNITEIVDDSQPVISTDNFKNFYDIVCSLLKEEYFNPSILIYLIYIHKEISFERLCFIFYTYERKYYIRKNLLMMEKYKLLTLNEDMNINLINIPKEMELRPFFNNEYDILNMRDYSSRIVLYTFINNVFNVKPSLNQYISAFPKRYPKDDKRNRKFIRNLIIEAECKYPFLNIRRFSVK